MIGYRGAIVGGGRTPSPPPPLYFTHFLSLYCAFFYLLPQSDTVAVAAAAETLIRGALLPFHRLLQPTYVRNAGFLLR